MAWKYQLIIKNPQSHPSRNRQPGLGKSGLSGRHAKAVGWLCNSTIARSLMVDCARISVAIALCFISDAAVEGSVERIGVIRTENNGYLRGQSALHCY
jgi:hypothetical protein